MSELRLNAIRLNTVSLNTMPVNCIGFKKKASSSASGDVDENVYIIFADPEVARICAENWGDGIGITKEQAAAVTSIGTVFSSNTTITSFSEFEYFTGVKTIDAYAFNGCTNLRTLGDLSRIQSIGMFALADTAYEDVVYLPSLTGSLSRATFRNTKITEVRSLGQCKKLNGYSAGWQYGVFNGCANLRKVVLPDTLEEVGYATFTSCPSLTEIVYDWSKLKVVLDNAFRTGSDLTFDELALSGLTTYGGSVFYGVPIRKLVLGDGLTSLPYSNGTYQNFGEPSALEELVFSKDVTGLPQYFLSGYNNIKSINLDNIQTLSTSTFRGYNGDLLSTCCLPSIVNTGDSAFRDSSITRLLLGADCTNFGSLYRGSINTVVCLAGTPPAFKGFNQHQITASSGYVYVPDASVEMYKTATNWAAYAARIFPISQLPTDNPELYAEIEKYL